MRIESLASKEEYLRALRQHMGSVADVGRQRFTGVIWGSFFYITHHASWEWNRKISGEKSSALGFVTATEGGCKVSCLKFLGASDPKSWIKLFLIFLVVAFLKGWDLSKENTLPLFLVCNAICSIGSAAASLATENGQNGNWRLNTLLRDPISFKKTK